MISQGFLGNLGVNLIPPPSYVQAQWGTSAAQAANSAGLSHGMAASLCPTYALCGTPFRLCACSHVPTSRNIGQSSMRIESQKIECHITSLERSIYGASMHKIAATET